jgi:hypothetical protein
MHYTESITIRLDTVTLEEAGTHVGTMEPPAIRTELGPHEQRLRRQVVVLVCTEATVDQDRTHNPGNGIKVRTCAVPSVHSQMPDAQGEMCACTCATPARSSTAVERSVGIEGGNIVKSRAF